MIDIFRNEIPFQENRSASCTGFWKRKMPESEERISPAFSSNGALLQFADKDLDQVSYGM